MSERPTIAVFASDKGPGDPERAGIMLQAGSFLARREVRILCLVEREELPVPLVTSARAAGGEVLVIAGSDFAMPSALVDIPLERHADSAARLVRAASLANGFVGLPGSLASASTLLEAWSAGRRLPGRRPVVLYNKNRAFEVMRGFAADIVSHGLHRHDRHIQFADNVEDLWNKLNWMLAEAQASSRLARKG